MTRPDDSSRNGPKQQALRLTSFSKGKAIGSGLCSSGQEKPSKQVVTPKKKAALLYPYLS
ncbi:hypothetical protein M413DRAFT_448972 [Hebeloma cylindrosporum]|uniref:Uncharacterized protein n=1 Tax=Hebeloma cylindrosporum TaxID=76867 RepID=A0A0C2XFD3_HEBCY|nr:hypothetical protein M413DRAFT_448972 [Hebeloma cylindrosporum h7]